MQLTAVPCDLPVRSACAPPWSYKHKLQAYTGIDQATVHKILREDLHMRKIDAKWVPHALTEQQKWYRYSSGKVSK